jgi:hypothetical protein
MNKPEALNGIVGELVRRGLPGDYAQRAAAEFADHHVDLTQELRAAGWCESAAIDEASRRLGDVRTLAEKTARQYQRRFWCGRWRIATFLLLPIPMLIGLWLVTILAWAVCVVMPLRALNLVGPEIPPDGIISTGEHIVSCLIQAWFLFAMPMLAMVVFVRLSQRAALGSRWNVLAGAMLALSALVFTCGYPDVSQHANFLDGRPVPSDQFMFTAGLPVPNRVFCIATLDRIGRIAVPFLLAGILCYRHQRTCQETQFASVSC